MHAVFFFSRQAARFEAEMTFKDISLADGKKKLTTIQKLKANGSHSTDVSMKRRPTRVDKARSEVLESFGGTAFDTLTAQDTR